MKWSAVASLCALPLALAGSIQADINLGKRGGVSVEVGGSSNNKDSSSGSKSSNSESSSSSSTTEIIVIWVNNGGGAATNTVNSAMAVSTAAAAAATHSVTVGGSAGLVYTPNTIEAAVGDMVIFSFQSENHTVTQSAFATPCDRLTGGMDSGFMPNLNNSVVPAPQVAMQVTVATPIWFYCRQSGHCGKGMTFSINPTANKTQAMFEQMAIAQNGTGAATGITAGSSSSGSSSAVSVAGVAATAAAAPSSAATSAAAAAVSSSASVSTGSGSVNAAGACDCSCLCGVADFPSAVQGLEAFGGMSGAMPAGARMMRV